MAVLALFEPQARARPKNIISSPFLQPPAPLSLLLLPALPLRLLPLCCGLSRAYSVLIIVIWKGKKETKSTSIVLCQVGGLHARSPLSSEVFGDRIKEDRRRKDKRTKSNQLVIASAVSFSLHVYSSRSLALWLEWLRRRVQRFSSLTPSRFRWLAWLP